MNNSIRSTLMYLMRFIPLNYLIFISKIDLIVGYYHIISDSDVLHVNKMYAYKNIKEFLHDLNYIKNNFNVINLNDVIMYIQGNYLIPKKAFLLTFDDGFREIYDIVYPILKEHKMKATIFINNKCIDNKEMSYLNKISIIINKIYLLSNNDIRNIIDKFSIPIYSKNYQKAVIDYLYNIKYNEINIINDIAKHIDVDIKEYLYKVKPYLTTEQINTMIKDGFSIGAHSLDHPYYSLISDEEKIYQTFCSLHGIKSVFGINYNAFAFPHTDDGVSEEVFYKLYDMCNIDVSFGTNGLMDDPIKSNIQRINLEKNNIKCDKILKYYLVKRIIKKYIGKNLINRS